MARWGQSNIRSSATYPPPRFYRQCGNIFRGPLMRSDPRLNNYLQRFQPFDFHAYEITLFLQTPPALYDPIHLDGLLSRAVVQNATQGLGLADSAEPYWLPLPLEKAWASEDGLPLWCSTNFYPLETDTITSTFWHKKQIRPEFLKRGPKGRPMNLRDTQGVTKEYRIPLPLHACRVWRATFSGDAHAVSELLKGISHVGKKKSQGYGSVERWEINEMERFSFFNDSGHPLRPIPTEFQALPGAFPLLNAAFSAWTPPYWHASLMKFCHLPVAD